jgi:anaerobic selenocysteine-containing dehydrogenase
MAVHHAVCPLDCPDRCSLAVTVEGGKIQKIGGSHKNPATDGYICAKVARFDRRVYAPERILRPALRVGPKGPGARFTDVSWDEALDHVAARWKHILAEHGPEALLPVWYAGSNGYLTGGGLDARLWARLGTTRALRTLCAANASAAVRSVYGDLPASDPATVADANLIVLWGVNPHMSGVHLVKPIKRALARGAQLIVVDPRQTPFSAGALHLAPRPGTDVAIALALLHIAFRDGHADEAFLSTWAEDAEALRDWVASWTPERAAALADVRAQDIEQFASWYASSQPAFLRCGWGVERNRNGTDAIRAILSLPAVYGKFGAGGGYAMSTSSGYRPQPGLTPESSGRVINQSHLGRALLSLEPPIRATWIYDCNPVATFPDQRRVREGLAREDLFTVVHEQVWNDTTDYADVVLPATTFLEHDELARSYGGYILQHHRPAIAPVGESRPNHHVFADLARRLGLNDPGLSITEDELAQDVVGKLNLAPPDAWDRLQSEGALPLPAPVPFVDTFPSRKIRLVGEDPPRFRPPPVDPDHPLVLISPASSRGISSTLFETEPVGQARIWLHPIDAARYGVVEGLPARVWNSQGEARLIAGIDATLREGVAAIPKGTWGRATLDGNTGNALVPDHVDERGGGACYNDARVSVAPA